jgi:ribosomal protein S18 acetylase RimI-like enzyme
MRSLLRLPSPESSKSAQSTAGTTATPDKIAHLMSIGVANDFRGRGVAEALSDHFCQAVAADGRHVVFLSVLAENSRAIHFYKRTGWQLVEEGESSLVFSRSLNVKRQTSNVIGCESPMTDDQ